MSFIQFNLPILRSSLTNNIIFHAALRSIKEYYTRGFYICQGNAKRHGQNLDTFSTSRNTSFWSVFSCIWAEYGGLQSESLYSNLTRQNTGILIFTQCTLWVPGNKWVHSLGASPTKWSNTFNQFVVNRRRIIW